MTQSPDHTEKSGRAGADLFLSFNSQDRALVEGVRVELARRGVTTFLDRATLTPGLPWAPMLDKALSRARAMAVFVGPHGLGVWQEREMALGLDRQANEGRSGHDFPVIPVLLAGAERESIPGFLRLNTWVDLSCGIDDPAGLDALAAVVRGVRLPVSPQVGTSTPARRRRRSRLAWTIGLPGTLVVGVVGAAIIASRPDIPAVYRMRVMTVDAGNTPVDVDSVWSNAGGEWKRVGGGWEVTIPEAVLPASRRFVVRAARPDAFERAVDSIALGTDANPLLTLHLRADTSAAVRGVVVDAQGRSVDGAWVSVDGYGRERALTDSSGGFVLPAHAADGQQVLLRAEKTGRKATSLYHPAGRTPATLQLDHLTGTP